MEKGRNSHIAILKLSQPLGHILASIHACAFFWFIIYFSDNFNEYTHFSNGNCYSYDSSIFHHSVICVRVLECMCAYWSLLFLTVFGKESCFFFDKWQFNVMDKESPEHALDIILIDELKWRTFEPFKLNLLYHFSWNSKKTRKMKN